MRKKEDNDAMVGEHVLNFKKGEAKMLKRLEIVVLAVVLVAGISSSFAEVIPSHAAYTVEDRDYFDDTYQTTFIEPYNGSEIDGLVVKWAVWTKAGGNSFRQRRALERCGGYAPGWRFEPAGLSGRASRVREDREHRSGCADVCHRRLHTLRGGPPAVRPADAGHRLVHL